MAENLAEENWTTLIEEHPKDVLDWALCVHQDKLVVGYLHDVKVCVLGWNMFDGSSQLQSLYIFLNHLQSVLQVHSLVDGKLIRNLPLEIGSIVAFSGHKKESEVFYQFVNFVTPGKNVIENQILATFD